MRLSIGVLVLAILTTNCYVHGYHQERNFQIKRLQQLLRRVELRSDNDLFFNRRATAEGDCTADILDGYQWNGEESMNIPGVDSTQRCMDNCDMDANCVGWSYKSEAKMCWGFSSVRGVIDDEGVRSGSCVGQNIKTKCVENKSGQYPGHRLDKLSDISTVQDCMAKCDEAPTCFGWLYDRYGKTCYRFDSLGTFKNSNGFLTGSCIAPLKRVRLAEPIKILRQDVLERHNEKRKKHCVSELTLDNDLNKVSQDLANELAAADVIPPEYDASKSQSVFFGKGDEALHGGIVVDNFYNEVKYYNYDEPDFSFTKYFPKIVWKSASKLGVGRALTADKKSMFIVMTYDSIESIGTGYQENIPKPCA